MDFAEEISKISGSVDQLLLLEKDAGIKDPVQAEVAKGPEIQEERDVKRSRGSDVRNSLNEDGRLQANALDLR